MGTGMDMVIGYELLFVGFVGAIITIRQFMQKGMIFSSVYFGISKEEREKIKSKKMYRSAAAVSFFLTAIALLFAAFFLLNNIRFAYIGAGISVTGSLIALLNNIAKK